MKGTFDLVKCDENLINVRLWICKDESQCQIFHHEKLQTPDYAQFMHVHFIQTVKVAKTEFNFASPFFLKFAKYDCAVTRFLCTFYFQKWNSRLSLSFSHHLFHNAQITHRLSRRINLMLHYYGILKIYRHCLILIFIQ